MRIASATAAVLGLVVVGGAAGAAGAVALSGSSPNNPTGSPISTVSSSSSGSTATSQMPPAGGACASPPTAVGTVKSVGTDTFTLTTADGSTVTVDVNSSTKYVDPSVSSPSFSDVTVGQHVAVMGTETSGTVNATSVLVGAPSAMKIGPGGPGGERPAVFGTVKTVGTDTFTLTTDDGTTVTVDVSSSTKYVDPAVSSPSFANVTVGENVAVFGTDTSNTVAATTVAVGPSGRGFGGGPGGPPGTQSYSVSGSATT